MTPWQQTFQNQKFLEKLDSVIAAFEGVSLKGLAKGDIEKHQRLLKVLKFARARLKGHNGDHRSAFADWGALAYCRPFINGRKAFKSQFATLVGAP